MNFVIFVGYKQKNIFIKLLVYETFGIIYCGNDGRPVGTGTAAVAK